jgi:hypothetical protein
VGSKAIQFFTHVGLGRDQDRFLMQPVGIEAIGLRQQRGDLFGEPRANRLRPTPGRQFGSLAKRGNFAETRPQQAAKRHPLAFAHLGKRAEHFSKAANHRGFGNAPVLFALLGVADLHHTLERQQTIERRRRRLDAPREFSRRREHSLKYGCVNPHDGRYAAAFDRQVCVNGPARQPLGGAGANRGFDRIPTRRHTKAQVETLAVDRLDLPGPGIRAAHSVAASKSRHARQRHENGPRRENREKFCAELSGRAAPSQG